MKGLMKIFAVLALFASVSTASASTVMAPTSGDVQFIFDAGLQLGIFDDVDTTFAGSHALLSTSGFDKVVFSGTTATSALTTSFVNLIGDDSFIVGLFTGGSWIGDSAANVITGTNIIQLTFNLPTGGGTVSTLIDVAPVPEPSTMLLMLLGVVTLLGFAVRREA
jgi:hypothetical protein